MVEAGPFFLLGDEQLVWRGGGEKINIVARNSLEINILTQHKLPDPPSPAESNGRPINFVVNMFRL